MTEDEMVGWYHLIHPMDMGLGGLRELEMDREAIPRDCKELDTTERLN